MNEQEMIKTVDIADFKSMEEKLLYIDNDVMVSQDINSAPQEAIERGIKVIRIKFFMVVNCIKGCLKLDVNGTTHEVGEGSALFVLPTMTVSGASAEEGTLVRIIGFSHYFLQNIVKREKGTERLFYTVYKNPVWHIDRNEEEPLLNHYTSLIIEKIKDKGNRYQKDILHYLYSAMFCEMMSELRNRMSEIDTEQPERSFRRSVYVFKQFLGELTKDGGKHRSVNYFADLLCYSPKYVSSVVKQVSGRTALDWINEYAVEQIKTQLRHSDKSIKEIADYFNFSNQSFFGKYVKKHLGTSPAKFRTLES